MNVSQLKQFCRDFPHSTEMLYGEPYNFLVYSVGGKKFAYFKTSEPERWRFSVRVTPDRFVELTDIAGVKPARVSRAVRVDHDRRRLDVSCRLSQGTRSIVVSTRVFFVEHGETERMSPRMILRSTAAGSS